MLEFAVWLRKVLNLRCSLANMSTIENVETSKKDIPEGFIMPSSAEIKPPPKDDASDDFWYDSGAESFGGSDEGSLEGSDAEMTYGKHPCLIATPQFRLALTNYHR